jgi:hypothetical protein
MPEYRIYAVDYNGHRLDAKNIECVDDQEAIHNRRCKPEVLRHFADPRSPNLKNESSPP